MRLLKSFLKCFLVAVFLLVIGVGYLYLSHPFLPSDVEAALHSPDKVVLYSLDSGNPMFWTAWEHKQPTVYGWANLGHTELKGSDSSFAVSSLWWRLVWYESPYSFTKVEPGCFNPHHIIQISSGGHVYDFVVCYACQWAEVYKDGIRKYDFGWSGDSTEWNSVFTRDKVPLPQHGVPSVIDEVPDTNH